MNQMVDSLAQHAENYAYARLGHDSVTKALALMNKPQERTPLPPSTIQAIMDNVDEGSDRKIGLPLANGSPEQIDRVSADVAALQDMYARTPDRDAFNELLRMYMEYTRQAARQANADLNIQFFPQQPKRPSFFMRGSASSFAPAIEGQMAEAQQAEFGPGASPLGEPLIYSATGAPQTPQQRRQQMEQAFTQGQFRPQLALPMSAVQAGMLRAREHQFVRASNTNVPVGGMLTDPRGAAYRKPARR
jgi:hypothetical protein